MWFLASPTSDSEPERLRLCVCVCAQVFPQCLSQSHRSSWPITRKAHIDALID